MSSTAITFYNAVICPYAQRAAIALKEVGAKYETVLIDLSNKPDWYGKINPDLKVPALTVGDQNIAESLVIIEYINDSFPEKKLLPEDPLKRAYVRYSIEFFGSKLISEHFKYLLNQKGENALENYKNNSNVAFERLNELLIQQSPTGPYFLGDQFSLADIAIAPFLLRFQVFNKTYLNGLEFDAVKKNPRLSEFLDGILKRPSVQETYCGDDLYFEAIARKFNVVK